MACTIDYDSECAMKYGNIHFGSLNDVINIDGLKGFVQGMEYLD